MYVRPSHKVVDKLAKLTGDQVDLNDDHRPTKTGPSLLLSRQIKNNLAILTLHRSLFNENIDIIRDIARDCIKIYSRIDERAQHEFFAESASKPYMASYLEKLLDRNQPSKAFIRTTFRQVIGFVTSQNRASFSENINYLLSFVNELRVAHSTSTHEDKKVIKSLSDDSIANVFDTMTKEAPLFLYWACIEVARYCVNESNISKDINVDDFLSILNSELSNTGKFSEKYLRQFFVIFIQSLEKALSYDIETSIRRSSFVSSASSRTHIPYNQMLHRWIVTNRENMADFSLRVTDPAQCWRNIDIKLSDDLALKHKSFSSMGSEISFERALDSLNARNWRKNLSLVTEAAIQLGDLDLLYGIESLANDSGLICDFPPLRPMISNLEGNFEQTHIDLIGKCSELDEQSLNEFLKSCVEMNLLKENVMNVDLLQSDWLKDSYKKLIESMDEAQQSLETRLQEVRQWLGTWSESQDPLNIDLTMSAYMRTVSKPPQELLPASHDQAEWFLGQEFIAQTLFSPSQVNSKFKIYNVLFEMLKLKDEYKHLPSDLVKIHSRNLRWNSELFRHVRDLNWLNLLRQQDDRQIDLVQYRAIKYHRQCKNTLTAMKLSEDLIERGISIKEQIQCSLLMTNETQSNIDKFKDILGQIEHSTLEHLDKIDLKSKVLRHFLRSSTHKAANSFILDASHEASHLKLETSDELSDINWQEILNSSRGQSKLRSLSLISKICHSKSESSSHTEQSISSVFKLDSELLIQLNQYKSAKYNSSAVVCAVRILKLICEHHSKLDQAASQLFSCQEFQEQTIPTWILIKNNLIMLVSNDRSDLPLLWRDALVNLLKVIVFKHPNILLYSIIVNRLESKFEPRTGLSSSSSRKSGSRSQEDVADLVPTFLRGQDKQFNLWQELYNYMKTNITSKTNDDWLEMIQETESFVREMRRISFLCGENLYGLSSEVSKKLARFSDRMLKQITSCGGQFPSEQAKLDCESRFRSICEHTLGQVDVLLLFSEGPNTDTYGAWFKLDFVKRLHTVKILMQHLMNNLLPFDSPCKFLADLQTFISNLSEIFLECQQMISSYSNQLWMHLISPKLSRLEPSEIPMPGCCSDPCDLSGREIITIHKVSQTVEMIASKTSPKRLILVGSDGIARSFLLKAHEDLRQDQYMMELFTAINKLLSGQQETQTICRLRNYSVTPIGSKSGLIEWVNAPALTSIYKDWLASSGGKLVIEDLYSSTCRVVCGTAEVGAPKSNHANCRMPHDLQMIDIFYQVLWAKAKQSNNQSELTEQKPSRDNILRYRAECEPSLFQAVHEQLIHRMPSDLISNSLWHRSINSYSYWKKTKQFTHSCATISMVGYMLGLCDRHLGNILLDYDTGEVIHIDFNLWFELGKRMSTPEQVPFRLTHNLIRAFGFAGLQGGFTQTSRKVLNLLRENKSTLLHLLEPANWSFMIIPNSRITSEPKFLVDMTANVAAAVDPATNSSPELECLDGRWLEETFRSQESEVQVERPKSQPVNWTTEGPPTTRGLGFFNKNDTYYGISKRLQLGSVDYDDNKVPFLNDLQVNIQTPLKIYEGTAMKMFERIRDKLCGSDEQLSRVVANKASLCARSTHNRPITNKPVKDLILLDDSLTTKDQVDALIIEASSLINKAAMYEGWMSWV